MKEVTVVFSGYITSLYSVNYFTCVRVKMRCTDIQKRRGNFINCRKLLSDYLPIYRFYQLYNSFVR